MAYFVAMFTFFIFLFSQTKEELNNNVIKEAISGIYIFNERTKEIKENPINDIDVCINDKINNDFFSEFVEWEIVFMEKLHTQFNKEISDKKAQIENIFFASIYLVFALSFSFQTEKNTENNKYSLIFMVVLFIFVIFIYSSSFIFLISKAKERISSDSSN